MGYLTFDSSESLRAFFTRKLNPTEKNNIEFCVMEKFPVNKILFTAEHAVCNKIPMKKFGKKAYIGIGDKNTDLLAKLAAFSIRSAYMIPKFLRTEADASRSPEELGLGLRLFSKIFYSKGQSTTYIPIHTDPSYLPYLQGYHRTIEELDPRTIISIHGMHIKRKFDLLFGFGENYEAIGGKKEAFRFKNEFNSFLDNVFKKLGLRGNLNIAVSTWFLTGSRNYVISNHVIEHNKKSENKRIGMQVEFNWRGRVKKGDLVPTLAYQVVVQALGDFIFKWTK